MQIINVIYAQNDTFMNYETFSYGIVAFLFIIKQFCNILGRGMGN